MFFFDTTHLKNSFQSKTKLTFGISLNSTLRLHNLPSIKGIVVNYRRTASLFLVLKTTIPLQAKNKKRKKNTSKSLQFSTLKTFIFSVKYIEHFKCFSSLILILRASIHVMVTTTFISNYINFLFKKSTQINNAWISVIFDGHIKIYFSEPINSWYDKYLDRYVHQGIGCIRLRFVRSSILILSEN